MNERRLAALKQDSSESDTEDGTSCKSLNGTWKQKTTNTCKPVIQWLFFCLFFNQDWLFCLIFVLSEDSISDKTSVTQVIPFQARNYYKSVSENKEITKLLSVLSSSISSSKKVHALRFSRNSFTVLYGFWHVVVTFFLKEIDLSMPLPCLLSRRWWLLYKVLTVTITSGGKTVKKPWGSMACSMADIFQCFWVCGTEGLFFFAFPDLSKTAQHCLSLRARLYSIEIWSCK